MKTLMLSLALLLVPVLGVRSALACDCEKRECPASCTGKSCPEGCKPKSSDKAAKPDKNDKKTPTPDGTATKS